jgi:hypothetical protein
MTIWRSGSPQSGSICTLAAWRSPSSWWEEPPLSLRGLVARTTEDVDVYACLDPVDADSPRLVTAQPLPEPLARAAAKVARDFDMPTDWINAIVSPHRPSELPGEFLSELSWRRYGGLRVGLAGRRFLISLKVHAAADRDRASVHVQDLLALAPADEELAAARAWVVQQDLGPDFPALVDGVISHVRKARSSGR